MKNNILKGVIVFVGFAFIIIMHSVITNNILLSLDKGNIILKDRDLIGMMFIIIYCVGIMFGLIVGKFKK